MWPPAYTNPRNCAHMIRKLGRPPWQNKKQHMTSQPYYVPLYPNYSLPKSDENSKHDLSETLKPKSAHIVVDDPIAQFLSDRLRIIERTIREVVEEIASRERLNAKVIDAIGKDELVQKERLFQVAPNGTAVFTVGDPRRRSAIESEIAALQKERRHEDLAQWKDISGLKRDLRELLREYREESRRSRVLQQ